MPNRPSKPGPASESPGFPSAAAANPLAGIAPLVAMATNLAVPDSHGAPDNVKDLTDAAADLAPPDTPVGEGGGGAPEDTHASLGVEAGSLAAVSAENPLDGLDALLDIATNLATPGSHAAPDNIDALIEAATNLAPPDTPAGGGADDAAVTEDGVRLGSGVVHAIEPAGHASEAAGLEMTQQGDDVFLITVGIGHAMDAVL